MISLNPKNGVRLLIACVVGIAFTWFIFGAINAHRQAAEQSRQRESQFVDQLNEKSIEEEIRLLDSGRSSGIYFYSTSRTDRLIKKLVGMPQIKWLTLETTDLSDAGAADIASLSKLEKLTIHSGTVSDVGLKKLQQVDTLETLHLINLDLTDVGLAGLQTLQNLETLTVYCDLPKSKLSDGAIQHLCKLKNLKKLNVGGGWLSTTAIVELKKSLPHCRITDNYADDEW